MADNITSVILNGRVICKHDIEENWKKAVNFIPLMAEIIVYETDSIHTQARLKIGDGKTAWVDLPEVTSIDEIDRFKVYANGKEAIQMFLKPQSIQAYLDEGDANESKNSNT